MRGLPPGREGPRRRVGPPTCGSWGSAPSVAQGERQGVHAASWAHRGPGNTRKGWASRGQLQGPDLGEGVRPQPGPRPVGQPPVAPSCITRAAHGGVRPAGVFFSSGECWRAARQLTVRTLRGLGVGRAPVADKVLQELRCLTAQLDSYGGEWGPARPLPRGPSALRPLSAPRPALPTGPARLGSLQHHLHAPLWPAVRLPGSRVRVPAGPHRRGHGPLGDARPAGERSLLPACWVAAGRAELPPREAAQQAPGALPLTTRPQTSPPCSWETRGRGPRRLLHTFRQQ